MSVLDRLEPHDVDDNVAEEFTELHANRAALMGLDHELLLYLKQAMVGGATWPGEDVQIDRITDALVLKSGQRYVKQLPAKERAAGEKIRKSLTTGVDQQDARSMAGSDLVWSSRKDVFKPKDLAAAVKGQDPAVVLGVIEDIFLSSDNAVWLGHFAILHTDAEVAALDVAVLDAVAKLLRSGPQRRRFEKARAAAHAGGAVSTATPDRATAAPLVATFRFTSYPNLASRLKGKHPEAVSAAFEALGDEAAVVAADFTRRHTDDELAALDAGLLHRLRALVTDAGERGRVQTALTRHVTEAGTRSKV